MRVNEFHQPEDVELAKSNGINYLSFYNRVYNLGWPIKRAATEPLRTRDKSLWIQYRDICKKNGVTQNSFYQRQYAGWTLEEATTIPTATDKGGLRRGRANALVSKKEVEIAKRNGISKPTLMRRVHYYHWSVQRATTEPIHTQYRRKS